MGKPQSDKVQKTQSFASMVQSSSSSNLSNNQLSASSDAPVSMQAAFECMQRTMSASAASGSDPSMLLTNQPASMQQAYLGLLRDSQAAAASMQAARDWPQSQTANVNRAIAPPPGRLSMKDAAMEVAERAASARNAASYSNRGANTGANQFVMRKQMVPLVPCRFFAEGFCQRGSSCTFLHAGKELCKFFVNGRCMKGDGCTAAHPEPEAAAPVAAFVDFDTGHPTSGLEFIKKKAQLKK